MSWLTRILGRDNAEERLADAHLQRADAARDLDETREVVRRVRRQQQDSFTKHMAAGFAARERREGRA
jgi:hypothetical protein